MSEFDPLKCAVQTSKALESILSSRPTPRGLRGTLVFVFEFEQRILSTLAITFGATRVDWAYSTAEVPPATTYVWVDLSEERTTWSGSGDRAFYDAFTTSYMGGLTAVELRAKNKRTSGHHSSRTLSPMVRTP